MTATNALIVAAEVAIDQIEIAAAECDVSYHACQDSYGLGVEALVGPDDNEKWVKTNDIVDEATIVKAVRLFDCDGSRGEACTTVEAVEEARDIWIGLIEQADGPSQDE